MRKEHILNSPRFEEYKKKKKKVLRRKIFIFSFLFLALFASLVFVSRIQKINIDQITVSGNKIVESKDVEAQVHAELAKKYLWLFPKSNAFIFPEKKIKKDLLTHFKRLTNVSIALTENNKELEITVHEREGSYLWCGDIKPTENEISPACYFLDSDGYIFDTAPYFSDGVYFKFYGKIEDEKKIGAYFNSEAFSKVIRFKESMEKMNLKPNSFVRLENGDMNMYLSSGAEIRFRFDADVDKLAQSLQAAITTAPFSTTFKNDPSSLLYIDLRFGNKVYFKFNE